MDEFPANLARIVSAARSAHDPRPEDARRVAKALSAVLPAAALPWPEGLDASISAAASAAPAPLASSATAALGNGAAVQAGFGGIGAFVKGIGVAIVAAGIGSAVTVQVISKEHAASERAAVATEVACAPAQSSPRAENLEQEAAPASVPMAAPVLAPAPRAEVAREGSVREGMRVSQTEQVRRRDGARVPPAPVATAAPPTAATAPLVTVSAEELRLIQQATQALRDHRAALAQELLQQHASLFPDGMLAQERSGLTVLALCQQGRLAEARPLRDRFLAQNPESPLSARVRMGRMNALPSEQDPDCFPDLSAADSRY